MKTKIRRNKIYNFRVSNEELQNIRELAREYDLPNMFREWIQELHNKHQQDPDEQIYEATVVSLNSKRS